MMLAPAVRWQYLSVLAYFGLAMISLLLAGQPGHVATLWFANPAGTVALLALPLRRWPVLLVALAAANLLANVAMTATTHGFNLAVLQSSIVFLPGNCAEMALAAGLLKRMSPRPDALEQPESLFRILLFGGLIPTLAGAFPGAALVSANSAQSFAAAWASWFEGSLIGTVAVLPLTISVWLQGWQPLRSAMQTRNVGLLLLSAGFTVLAGTSLPQPFVVMSIALSFLAVCTNFSFTAAATLISALIAGALIAEGVLIAPPSSTWWGDSLFYSSLLATLLPGLFLATLVDGQRTILQRLTASERRFRTLYTQTPAMLQTVDSEGKITSVSQRWTQTMGYAESEAIGHPSTEFMTPESKDKVVADISPRTLREGRCEDIELQMITRSGQVVEVMLSAVWEYEADGSPRQQLAVLQDVTEKKHFAARSHFAEHDPLTGLPNRVLLQDRLERTCAHHARYKGIFAVGFLDLDHFKSINDTHGHEAGDALLCEVTRRLTSAVRDADTVSRVGGDEFVLLFSEIEDATVLPALIDKVMTQVVQPFTLHGRTNEASIEVSASMGIALYPNHGRDPQSLLLHADQAMYVAKRGGRNRCEFYNA